MKTFKNIKALERRLQKDIAWEDYFKLNGRMFNIYEYGGGSFMKMDYDYIYFLNKRSGDMIYIKYDCPSTRWVNGKQVKVKDYRFISLECLPQATQWR